MFRFADPIDAENGFSIMMKLLVIISSVILTTGMAASTNLNNIESITPSGSNPIYINGTLNMNGNPINSFFGSSCSTGQVVAHVNDDGTLDCVDATGEVQNDFVDRSGDTMTGTLDMSGDTIDLGAASNAAPPTGVIKDVGYVALQNQEDQDLPTNNQFTLFADHSEGLQYNDANHNDYVIASRTWVNNNDDTIADNQQLSISGDTISLDNGGSVTIQDDTIPDDQNLGYSNDNAPTGSYATHTVTIDNGNGATIRDYYEPDTTIADNQNLGSSRSGDTVTISIDNGNGASFTDNYEADTSAATQCSGNDYLAGDGTCNVDSYQANTDNQDLSNVVGQGNSISSGQTIDASAGAFRLPVGADAY